MVTIKTTNKYTQHTNHNARLKKKRILETFPPLWYIEKEIKELKKTGNTEQKVSIKHHRLSNTKFTLHNVQFLCHNNNSNNNNYYFVILFQDYSACIR